MLSTRIFVRFSSTAKHFAYFESVLGPGNVLREDLDKFNTDWTGKFKGNSSLVLQPHTTSQVSSIMKYAYANELKIVPQGGNTGLVGGSIPIQPDEIILSLSKMNKILSLNDNVLIAEAGVVLQDAESFCQASNLTMPLDLGSKGSCQLGGNLSTNAGGIRYIRFGSLRSNCLGLTVVLSNGDVLSNLRSLKKDNVGYDLKQLFIGAEGTLGIITEAALMVHSRPFSSRVAFFGVQRFQDVCAVLQVAKEELGGALSACEYFDSNCIFSTPSPFDRPVKFFVLIEAISRRQEDDESIESTLETIYSRMQETSSCDQAIVSQSDKQFHDMWKMRESITWRLKTSDTTSVFKFDVSLPTTLFDHITQEVKLKIHARFPEVKVYQFGHLGDGNLHFNATTTETDLERVKEIQHFVETCLYDSVQEYQGSISAEHGLGQLKASKVLYSRSPCEVEWMKKLKRAMDPKNVLNPGKVVVLDED